MKSIQQKVISFRTMLVFGLVMVISQQALGMYLDKEKLLQAAKDGAIIPVKVYLGLQTSPMYQGAALKPNEVRDSAQKTPLHWAAQNGHLEVVKILLSAKADPNVKDDQGNTPLHLASSKKDKKYWEIVVEFLNNSSNPAKPDSQNIEQQTPLWLAAKAGAIDTVRSLLGHNASPLLPNKVGQTPLHIATKNDDIAIMKELLKVKNINPNIQSIDGIAPLHLAQSAKAVALLFGNNETNPDIQDGIKNTPLHYATAYEFKPVVQELLKKASPDIKDDNDETPLLMAVVVGNLDIVNFLLAAKANPNTKYKNQNTPLYLAIISGEQDLVQALLEAGADPDMPGKDNTTPLWSASDMGLTEIVKKLLAHHARPNIADTKYGNTPLHIASQQGHAEIVKLLLAANADKEAKNRDGKTPLELADDITKDAFNLPQPANPTKVTTHEPNDLPKKLTQLKASLSKLRASLAELQARLVALKGKLA